MMMRSAYSGQRSADSCGKAWSAERGVKDKGKRIKEKVVVGTFTGVATDFSIMVYVTIMYVF